MKKKIGKVVLKMVLAPFSIVVWALYTAGCMLKTVSYLLIGEVEDADKELDKALMYE